MVATTYQLFIRDLFSCRYLDSWALDRYRRITKKIIHI